MDTLFLDIETIPTQREDVRAYIAATVKHPGTISKPESIAKWNEESRPGAIEAEVGKTGFEGAFGQIVCIGWAWNDEPAQTARADDTALDTERALLQGFADAVITGPTRFRVVGHNVAAFDLRFIRQRSMVHGIRLPASLPFDAKPWDGDAVFDTMVQWAGVGKTISMDKLCLAFGIPGKGDMSGADVWPMVQAGRFDDVAAYCRGDVERTREIYRRMTFGAVEAVKLRAA